VDVQDPRAIATDLRRGLCLTADDPKSNPGCFRRQQVAASQLTDAAIRARVGLSPYSTAIATVAAVVADDASADPWLRTLTQRIRAAFAGPAALPVRSGLSATGEQDGLAGRPVPQTEASLDRLSRELTASEERAEEQRAHHVRLMEEQRAVYVKQIQELRASQAKQIEAIRIDHEKQLEEQRVRHTQQAKEAHAAAQAEAQQARREDQAEVKQARDALRQERDVTRKERNATRQARQAL